MDAGLSPAEFVQVFMQCAKCAAVTARRNVHFHSCVNVRTSVSFAPLDRIDLLHCVATDGLKPECFEALMSYCEDCDKFMTHRAGLHHDCVFFKMYFGEDLGTYLESDLDMSTEDDLDGDSDMDLEGDVDLAMYLGENSDMDLI